MSSPPEPSTQAPGREAAVPHVLGFSRSAAHPIIETQKSQSVGLFTPKVSDCSPANRERELGLDRRETG